MLTVSEAWKSTYPGAAAGILTIRDVSNAERHPGLDERKVELEQQLRSRFAGFGRADLKALPTLQAYDAYYKRFKKTYHVQHQLESIVFKGKSIPRVATLVEAMFMAELKNMLLTAGHDLNVVHMPVELDISDGSESFVKLNGQEQTLKSGDMRINDSTGVISSVIYGPDYRTRITAKTQQVLFTVYAPPGIGEQAITEHLQDIHNNIALVSPKAVLMALEVYGTE
jgi:DNA/RNA-binding domain of Phe-tRNA-synthetase-like protein